MSTEPVKKPDVTCTIDGIEVTVPAGTLVIRAAEQIGVEIPRFCDHPLLKPVGACRQCLVEIATPGPDGSMRTMQGPPGRMKPQASCTIEVSEGMQVNTQLTSPGAEKAQRGVMELLLINHPLDCPVCDKGGECPLQNQAMSHGGDTSRFSAPAPDGTVGEKRTFPKPIALSSQILLDRERCIVCQRCTRFADEVAGDPFIELLERGAQQQIGIAEGVPFGSYFAGNTIQICPVGALTSNDYRFRSRPFDLVSTPGVAEHDACGAAIRVDHRRGKVLRRLAGDDAEVNTEWISDKDRFAFSYTREVNRITHPWVRDVAADGSRGELRPAAWPEAWARAAAALVPESTGVLPGGRLTVEDAWAWSRFARTVLRTNDVDFRSRPADADGSEEAHLRHFAAGRRPDHVTYSTLEQADTVVLVALEPEDEAATLFLRLRTAAVDHGTRVVAVAPFTSRGSAKLRAEVTGTAPGAEAQALARLGEDGGLTAASVILVGERIAGVEGGWAAAAELAERTGAKLAWVPRRAGDRAALDAGCLPGTLPGGRRLDDAIARAEVEAHWGPIPTAPGRDLAGILTALRTGELRSLLVGGVDLDDTADPAAFREALAAAEHVVSIELAWSEAARAADVVLPVAPVTEKSGTYLTWDGRRRSFDTAIVRPGVLSDAGVLAGIATQMGGGDTGLDLVDVAGVRREILNMGARPEGGVVTSSSGRRPAAASDEVRAAEFRLATWRQLVDLGSLQSANPAYLAGARPTVLRIRREDALALDIHSGDVVEVAGSRGVVRVPCEGADLPEGTVWLPTRSPGCELWRDLAAPGESVEVRRIAERVGAAPTPSVAEAEVAP